MSSERSAIGWKILKALGCDHRNDGTLCLSCDKAMNDRKISENPYTMVGDPHGLGTGEVGRLYGVSIDMASGCDRTVERKPYSGDAGDETE